MGTQDALSSRVKDIIDFSGSVLLLAVFSPILVLIALAVKLQDGGRIFHKRRVVGVGGVHFDALKFRTMVENADEWLAQNPQLMAEFKRNYKLAEDPRVTKLGKILRKFSLDELPQLFNVLCGQMSLVGPRMVTPEELEKYGSLKEARVRFKPGLSGYWQVNGRQEVDYEERVEMDRFYIEHWSIRLDIGILFKTVYKVLRREGAF